MTPLERLRQAHVAVEGAARNLLADLDARGRVSSADLRTALAILTDAQQAHGSPLWSALEQVDAGRVVNPLVTCRSCAGTGRQHAATSWEAPPCSTCNGNGKVSR